MKAKKILSTILSAAMVLTMFASCSDGGAGNSVGTESTGSTAGTVSENKGGGEGKLTLQVAVSGSAQEIAIHQQKFDLFMEENSDIYIEPVDIGSERVQKTMTLISAGEAPDILYINEMIYAFADKGVLLPLNEKIEADGFDTSIFMPNLLEPLTYEGELFGLPQEISPFVIYYNKDMFEEAGVPLPTDDWTVDEFYDAAKKLTDPEKKVYGYRHPANWPDQVWNWLSRFGGDYQVTGNKSEGFDSPEVLEALTFLHQMVVVDKVSPNPADLSAMGKGADVMFVNKTSAMESAGLWLLPQYKAEKLDFNWDVVRVPKAANQNTLAGILNWGISKDSKHVDEAWELLKFLVGPECMKVVAENGMALPGSNDEEANQMVLDTKFPDNVQAFVDSVESVDFRTQKNTKYTEIADALNAQMELLLLDQQTPEETQQAIIENFDQILSEKN